MLELNHVYKNYKVGNDEVKVLKDVSLEIEQGEFVAILGPSGCGKTTLLNLIAGMDQTSNGKILFHGEVLNTYKDKAWAAWRRAGVGYIFQQFNLLDYMTARQNIELVLKLNGIGKSEQRTRSEELLELVGLKDRANHLPAQLSGGQKQRVAIARAMANNPEILLADEPTGAVDSQTAEEIIALLKKINREKGVTIIMVTHDMKMAESANRKVSMLDGQIVGDTLDSNMSAHEASGKKITVGKENHFFLSMACKNLFTRKKRTILTALATAIGIAGVLVAFGIGFGVKERIIGEIGGIVNVQAVDVVEADAVMDEENMHQLLARKDVLNVYPNNRPEAVCNYKGSVCEALVRVIGPVEQPVSYWEDNLEYGRLPQSNDCCEAVITETMAQNFVGEGNAVESLLGKELDVVFITSAQSCIPKQAERTITVVGIAGSSLMGVEAINIPYALAETVTKESLMDEHYHTLHYCVTVTNEKAAEDVKNFANELGFDASLDEEALGTIGTAINMVIAVIMMIAGIALIVAGIMIALVTYIGVVERTREIGTLRAIGFSAKHILRMFLTEGGLIGFFAGIIGIVMASGIGSFVNFIVGNMYKELAFQLYRVNARHILVCLAFSILIGLLCSYSPARRASKMEPVRALGYVQ